MNRDPLVRRLPQGTRPARRSPDIGETVLTARRALSAGVSGHDELGHDRDDDDRRGHDVDGGVGDGDDHASILPLASRRGKPRSSAVLELCEATQVGRARVQSIEDRSLRRAEANDGSRKWALRLHDCVLRRPRKCSIETAARPNFELLYREPVRERTVRARDVTNAAVEELVSPDPRDPRIVEIGPGRPPKRDDAGIRADGAACGYPNPFWTCGSECCGSYATCVSGCCVASMTP